MAKTLKEEQQQAITLKNDLLVSANAGSGKTFVMLERVIHQITEENASVLDFLLITFTDAASMQMRNKLAKALIKKYNEEGISLATKNHLKKELSLISVADISTIHTFCFKLIKKYFFAVGVNAGVKIADEEESQELKEKALSETLDKFAKEGKNEFFELLSSYDSARNFEQIKEIVLKIFNYLQNLPNPENFKMQIMSVYQGGLSADILKVIDQFAVDTCTFFAEEFKDIKKNCPFDKIVSCCDEVISKLGAVNESNGFENNLKTIFLISLPDKPRKTTDEDFNATAEQFGNLKKELKDELDKLKNKIYLSDDISKLEKNILWCKQNVEMLINLEEEFEENYKKIKAEKNLLDFSDLEHFAYKILCDENLCKEIAQKYKEIFVDEYQDVNDIQEGIILKLWKQHQNTLFLVGDPKQSIYRFRNTNPEIMISKLKAYESGQDGKKVIILKHNFRSDENILDFVNFVFSKIMTEKIAKINYEKTGMFQAGIDFLRQDLPTVEIDLVKAEKQEEKKQFDGKVYSVKQAKLKEDEILYAESEAFVILEKIANLMDGKHQIYDTDIGMRDVKFSDIAILYRSKREEVERIVKILKDHNIPVKSVSSENLLDTYEVQVLFNFLTLLQNTKNDFALAGFLSSPIIDLSFSSIASLRAKQDKPFWEICKNSQNEKIKYAFSLVDQGRKMLVGGTIYDVLSWLIQKTNYLSLLASMPESLDKINGVKVYVDHFKAHSYNSSLVSYLSYVENSAEIKTASKTSGDENAVNILSMHKSKGLEFPVVFVVDMAKKFNHDSLKGACLFSSNLGIGVQVFDKQRRYRTSTLARSAIILEEKEQEFAEELRVLYVGLTRAKNHLYIIGKGNFEKLKAKTDFTYIKRQDNFLSIILSCLKESEIFALQNGKEKMQIKSSKNSSFYINVYSAIKKSDYISKNSTLSRTKLQQSDQILQNIAFNEQKTSQNVSVAFKNSVSRIMEEEEVGTSFNFSPKKFKLSENMPTADQIGNAYHKAMELVPLEFTSFEQVEAFLKENLETSVFNLIDCGKILKCVKALKKWTFGADRIIREGKFFLKIPYNKIIPTSTISDEILIQGIVDFVAIKGKEAVLIDYKTTRLANEEEMRQKYQIQMESYKIAVENALNLKVSHKILYSFFKDCEILFDK